MTLEDSAHDFRLLVLREAKETGNVSAVCREFGISRTLFYRWKRRLERYGADGVHPRRRAAYRISPGKACRGMQSSFSSFPARTRLSRFRFAAGTLRK